MSFEPRRSEKWDQPRDTAPRKTTLIGRAFYLQYDRLS